MGYLDHAGLSHFWGKVKAALAAKQDKLAGAAGQVVGFGADGVPEARSAEELKGPAGKSAYQYAVDGGYTGTDAEFQALMGSGPWLPLEEGVRMLSAVIPKGRMRGDVNGDGKITQKDIDLVGKFIANLETPSDIQAWCADVDNSGYISNNDITALSRIVYLGYVITNWTEYYENWTYISDQKLWTADIAVTDLTAGLSAVVVIDGEWENGMFSGAEVLDGILRISSTAPPITDASCKIILTGTSGAASTIFKAVASAETSGFLTAKVYNGTLSASGWDAAKKTLDVDIDGFYFNEKKQFIQVFPYDRNADAYKNSGINIYNWGDGFVTFSCETIPTKDILIHIVVTDV